MNSSSCLIVTRTRSRPLLLMRAVESVCAQTYREFTWTIVNDGGEREPAERAAAVARARGIKTVLLHQSASQGMEAASNIGVRSANSLFVAIHDDDDSWAPEFLQRCSSFLAQHPEYVAVTTHCTRIDERIDGPLLRVIRRSPHKPVLTCVQLADILEKNLFPPISLLYRRDIYDAVGGYDETMQVLGDWDFNIRILLRGDIGVLPEPLANYHVRVGASVSALDANSLTPGASLQQVADAAYRNRMLRRDIAQGRPGLGFLLALARPVVRANARNRFVSWFRK